MIEALTLLQEGNLVSQMVGYRVSKVFSLAFKPKYGYPLQNSETIIFPWHEWRMIWYSKQPGICPKKCKKALAKASAFCVWLSTRALIR